MNDLLNNYLINAFPHDILVWEDCISIIFKDGLPHRGINDPYFLAYFLTTTNKSFFIFEQSITFQFICAYDICTNEITVLDVHCNESYKPKLNIEQHLIHIQTIEKFYRPGFYLVNVFKDYIYKNFNVNNYKFFSIYRFRSIVNEDNINK